MSVSKREPKPLSDRELTALQGSSNWTVACLLINLNDQAKEIARLQETISRQAEEITRLKEVERKRELVKSAINNFMLSDDCKESCDSYGHAEDCKHYDFADRYERLATDNDTLREKIVCQVEEIKELNRALIETVRKGSGQCRVQRSADPPRDCGYPFCGCFPEADRAIEAVRECGWMTDEEGEELRGEIKGLTQTLDICESKEQQLRQRLEKGQIDSANDADERLRLAEEIKEAIVESEALRIVLSQKDELITHLESRKLTLGAEVAAKDGEIKELTEARDFAEKAHQEACFELEKHCGTCPRIASQTEVLRACALKFREYEQIHRKLLEIKTSGALDVYHDGVSRAEVNAAMARMCEKALGEKK